MVPVTMTGTPLGGHVLLVVIVSAKKEMAGITAEAVIAFMAYKQFFRIALVKEVVDSSVSSPLDTLMDKYPISREACSRVPFPAGIRRVRKNVYLAKQSGNQRTISPKQFIRPHFRSITPSAT